jgi:hypothetical protein
LSLPSSRRVPVTPRMKRVSGSVLVEFKNQQEKWRCGSHNFLSQFLIRSS